MQERQVKLLCIGAEIAPASLQQLKHASVINDTRLILSPPNYSSLPDEAGTLGGFKMYAKNVASPANRLVIALAASFCAFTTINAAIAMLVLQGGAA